MRTGAMFLGGGTRRGLFPVVEHAAVCSRCWNTPRSRGTFLGCGTRRGLFPVAEHAAVCSRWWNTAAASGPRHVPGGLEWAAGPFRWVKRTLFRRVANEFCETFRPIPMSERWNAPSMDVNTAHYGINDNQRHRMNFPGVLEETKKIYIACSNSYCAK